MFTWAANAISGHWGNPRRSSLSFSAKVSAFKDGGGRTTKIFPGGEEEGKLWRSQRKNYGRKSRWVSMNLPGRRRTSDGRDAEKERDTYMELQHRHGSIFDGPPGIKTFRDSGHTESFPLPAKSIAIAQSQLR